MKLFTVIITVLTVLFVPPGGLRAADLPVIDGDGLRLKGEHVRLWGIDAPELGQECTRDSASYRCGDVAKEALRALIGARPVECEKIETDRFGRTVARCTVDGLDLGSLMVNAGWALDFKRYSDGRYAAEQQAAQEARRGLWGGEFVPPWVWRDRNMR